MCERCYIYGKRNPIRCESLIYTFAHISVCRTEYDLGASHKVSPLLQLPTGRGFVATSAYTDIGVYMRTMHTNSKNARTKQGNECKAGFAQPAFNRSDYKTHQSIRPPTNQRIEQRIRSTLKVLIGRRRERERVCVCVCSNLQQSTTTTTPAPALAPAPAPPPTTTIDPPTNQPTNNPTNK